MRAARRRRRAFAALRVAVLAPPVIFWAAVLAALAGGRSQLRSALEERAMNSNVNLESAVGALGFLGACFVLLALGLVTAHELFVRRHGRAKA